MAERVLVVDDDVVARTVVTAQLEQLGYEVVVAGGVEEAVLQATAANPQVVLLDYELPDGDGLTVLDQLQADEDLRRIPVVFLTGRTSTADVAEALRRGAHDYLRKPAEKVELAARVAAAARVQRLQAELRRQARTDELTGLPNRRAALDVLEQAESASARWQLPVSVLVLDVDHFKRVNDVYGHDGGDRVLAAVAERLSGALRAEDLCARWGGEEFLVVVLGVPERGSRVAAERLRSAVAAEPFVMLNGGEQRISLSVGVAVGVAAAASALVRLADEALYRAKAAGRDRVEVHEGLVPRQAGPRDED